MWYVYHIAKSIDDSLTNGYVGVTIDLDDRWNGHLKSKYKVGNAIRKHNLTRSNMNIVSEFNSSEEAYFLERELRPLHNMGWNITPGGNGFTDGHRQDSYMRAKMSLVKKNKSGKPQSDEHYSKLAKLQQGVKRPVEECLFCRKTGGKGNMQRWHFANCKNAPIQSNKCNGYDFDGVISLGIRPWPGGVIITGRSYEEKNETLLFMKNRDIDCKVFFSPHSFENKTREKSGHHKGQTIWNLFCNGTTIQIFYEDDWDQYQIIKSYIKKYALPTKLVWVNHGGLIELENVRRTNEV